MKKEKKYVYCNETQKHRRTADGSHKLGIHVRTDENLTGKFPSLISVFNENDGYVYPWGAANSRDAAFEMIRKHNRTYDQFYCDDLCPFVTLCESCTYDEWKELYLRWKAGVID